MTNNNKPKIEIIDDPNLKRVYSNYVSVTTAPHECNLTFCYIDPLDKGPSKIIAKVIAKVMIPNSLVEEMVRIIELNFNKTRKILEEIKSKK